MKIVRIVEVCDPDVYPNRPAEDDWFGVYVDGILHWQGPFFDTTALPIRCNMRIESDEVVDSFKLLELPEHYYQIPRSTVLDANHAD